MENKREVAAIEHSKDSDCVVEAMISTLDGDWDVIALADAEKLVAEGKAYRCSLCSDYDDKAPSFHYTEAE